MGQAAEVYPSSSSSSSRGWSAALRVETLTAEAPNNAVKVELLSVFLGARCLLRNANLTIAENSRLEELPSEGGKTKTVRHGTCYGLVGPNGCGKSTLLRLLAEGHVPTPAAWPVFLVGQHLPTPADRSVVEEVLSADTQRTELLELQQQLEVCITRAAEEPGEEAAETLVDASSRLADVQVQLGRWQGSSKEVIGILLALGFRRQLPGGSEHCPTPAADSPMRQLSGGWRMKVELAKALWLKPKLLLLDEPTNHLDFEALQWLEGQLDEYPHTTVVVSHDVAFLHNVCKEIFWLRECRIESVPRDVLTQEDLARMQRSKPLSFRFALAGEGSPQDHGVSVHQAEFAYPPEDQRDRSNRRVLRMKGTVRFSGRSRAVLLGKNGSGKSTFLGLCARHLQPCRGSVDHTDGCRVGYYSQQMDEIESHGDLTAVQYIVETCRDELEAKLDAKVKAAGGSAEKRMVRATARAACGSAISSAFGRHLTELARGALSGFGFEGDLAVGVPIARLSGGQKARLKLAVLALRPAHILFMDEPTNHLDAEACEALAEGLSEFKGGIVVVSHDDLLVYRLIQCNWGQSELLICQGGTVELKKEFGGHCLKTLKEHMRKSEVVEPSGREAPQTAAPTPTPRPAASSQGGKREAALPPWLRRAAPAAAVRRMPLASDPSEDVSELGRLPHFLGELDEHRSPSALAAAAVQPEAQQEGFAHDSRDESTEDDALFGSGTKETNSPLSSGHSRLRKDVVNLNKSVEKWLLHEARGLLSREQLVQRIRQSTAAKHLAASQGSSFREDEFVAKAIVRAETLAARRQEQEGPKPTER